MLHSEPLSSARKMELLSNGHKVAEMTELHDYIIAAVSYAAAAAAASLRKRG